MFRKLANAIAQDAEVSILIDGDVVLAEKGETVAAVILRQESIIARTTPVGNQPRAPYCMMGVCFECLAIVDGIGSTQTCMVAVQAGMRVERQHGRRVVLAETFKDGAGDETGPGDRPLNKARP